MNIPSLKEKMLSSLDTWFKGRVDEMVGDNPTLAVSSVYIKRGCHNLLNKYSTFDIGLVQGVVGKGRISITLPDNIFTNIIFGNKKTITFNENDFLELKALLVE